MAKQTTKICPNCGSTALALFTSMNMKLCVDCYTELPWYLDEGQQPLIGSSIDTGTVKKVTSTDNQ